MLEQHQWMAMMRRSFHPRDWFEKDGDSEEGTMEDKLMWVYRKTEAGFTVGFYSPSREWHVDSDHPSKEQAAARVHYLNGGGVEY